VDIAMPRTALKLHPLRRWLVSLALAAAPVLPAVAHAQVVVVANGSPITDYDIQQRSKLMATSTHKTPPRQEVINELIDDRLKIARAKVYGLEVTDKELSEAFANMAKRQHLSVAQFTQMVERSGISPETIKARMRAELTWNQLIRGKFGPSLQIGDSDIATALRARNEGEAAGETIGYIYTLYPIMIVVPRGSAQGAFEAKRKEAESLRARFVACKEGLDLARALPDVAVREPVTKSSSDLPTALRDLLGSMPMGHLTTPDVTAQGLQMFALCEKKATKTDSPIKHEIHEKLFNDRFNRESKRYLDELRASAMIEYKEKQ
jgi:peptidyl-prolyl cis-trans isomerase SurA